MAAETDGAKSGGNARDPHARLRVRLRSLGAAQAALLEDGVPFVPSPRHSSTLRSIGSVPSKEFFDRVDDITRASKESMARASKESTIDDETSPVPTREIASPGRLIALAAAQTKQPSSSERTGLGIPGDNTREFPRRVEPDAHVRTNQPTRPAAAHDAVAAHAAAVAAARAGWSPEPRSGYNIHLQKF